MVSKEEIEAEGLTNDEVLAREFVEPQEDVKWLPEWDEYPDEKPGENTRIEDGWLLWQRDGFEARLTNVEPTKWRAIIDVPEDYGDSFPREFDLKCRPKPEHGFVESAEVVDYSLSKVTLILSENYQPDFEVNRFIDYLIECDEGMEEYMAEVEEKLAAAKDNEE